MKKPIKGDFELGEEHASPGALNKAKKLAAEAMMIEQKVEGLDEEMSLLGKRLVFLKREAIPEALRQAGISTFTALDGRAVEVEDAVFGSLPKEEPARSTAIAKMEEYGLGGNIRTVITIDFAKEDRDEAVKLYKQLRKNNAYNIEMKESIHSSTYTSVLKQRLEAGEPLDAKALSIFVGHNTKFKKPKKGRKAA
jgi:hypothetical protein